jgi:hypothetical protein
VESEDVAQDEDGELARWQDLKSGREGQGDGFGLLRNGLTPEPKLRRPTPHEHVLMVSLPLRWVVQETVPKCWARSRVTLGCTVGNGCPVLLPIVCQWAGVRPVNGEVSLAVTVEVAALSRQIGGSSGQALQ